MRRVIHQMNRSNDALLGCATHTHVTRPLPRRGTGAAVATVSAARALARDGYAEGRLTEAQRATVGRIAGESESVVVLGD